MIAYFLKARGVNHVLGLCGGHIMPIWMRVDAEGICIIDTRDERAAVSGDAKSGLAWAPDLQPLAL